MKAKAILLDLQNWGMVEFVLQQLRSAQNVC